MVPDLGWWRRRRLRRECFHHDHRTGVTRIVERIIDGARKLYRCTGCGRIWIK